MPGDRRVEHLTDHDRTLIALVGMDLIDALEDEFDIGALATVENRKLALAGVRRDRIARAGDRHQRGAHRISDALAMCLGHRDAIRRGDQRRLSGYFSPGAVP